MNWPLWGILAYVSWVIQRGLAPLWQRDELILSIFEGGFWPNPMLIVLVFICLQTKWPM